MTAASPVGAPARVHRGVTSRKLKIGVFALAGSNALATVYFFYYIYFYTRDKFGFGEIQNFLLAALLGLIYGVFAFLGGRFAQRAGYFASFQLGVGLMFAAFLLVSQVDSLWPTLALIVVANIGMCFTWPPLQGLMSEGEPQARLRGLVGIYNCTWAGGSAVAYFTGGAMQKGWGQKSMFYVPAGLLFLQAVFSRWLEKGVNEQPISVVAPAELAGEVHVAKVSPKTFLKMAWLANPFSYLAISAIVATIPTLANRLNLGQALAGVVCSVWLFARVGAFVLLWLWPNWHYKFRFLLGAYLLLIVCFTMMLLAPGLWVLVLSQIGLGLALGLIYYSSLFYSMDVGETKGEHGGIHEGAIGAGSCGGPALAAGALYLFPSNPASGPLAVSLLLLLGLGGLIWLRFRRQGLDFQDNDDSI